MGGPAPPRAAGEGRTAHEERWGRAPPLRERGRGATAARRERDGGAAPSRVREEREGAPSTLGGSGDLEARRRPEKRGGAGVARGDDDFG